MLPDHWVVHRAVADLVELTAYSTAARYPDAEPSVDRSDASEAIDLSRHIYEAITIDLAREGVDLEGRRCE
jgi:HEPN domain-containing protein